MKNVRKWLEANCLALNIGKNNFVLFHPPRHKFNAQITLKFGKKKISQETCIKFLGVLLDSHLSWKSHITELSKKLSRTVGLFYKVRHYAPLETLKLLYHGIFHPFISYGVQVWGLTYKSHLDPVFVLQKKTLKAITFCDIRSPSTAIFCDLDLLTLCDICNLQVASFVFECINGLSPSYFHEYFKLISSKHTIRTRQSTIGNLFLERRNTDRYGRRSIQFYGVILWNSIPCEIRNLTTTGCFRTELKKHYISL